MEKQCFLIAGPTASGKSAFALRLAKEKQGIIVNADSMQVYKGLALLTACPNDEDLKKCPHYLYNYVLPEHSYSVGNWLKDVKQQLEDYNQKNPVIFVGGTGLYFHALLGNLADIPDVSEEIRIKWQTRWQADGGKILHQILRNYDPISAKKISEHDGQRLLRALEVYDMTKKPLSFWQKQPTQTPLKNYTLHKYLLMPERETLHQNIKNRLNFMFENGVIEEVEAFLKKNVPYQNSSSKAIGISQIGDYLAKKISLYEVKELINIKTRQYAKRQRTWFKNQMDSSWQRLIY